MDRQRRWIAGLILGFLAGHAVDVRGGDDPIRASAQTAAPGPRPSPQVSTPLASPQGPRLPIPAGLPRYDLDARLDIEGRRVSVRERVQFTNRSSAATNELVFHVYPRFQVQGADKATLSKTLEILRLSPDEAMDT